MLKPLPKIIKAIAAHVPGTALYVAQAKRAMQNRLRAAGYSRKQAMALTVEHFSKHLKEHK